MGQGHVRFGDSFPFLLLHLPLSMARANVDLGLGGGREWERGCLFSKAVDEVLT